MTEAEETVVVAFVEDEFPGMPMNRGRRPTAFEDAHDSAIRALELTQERLRELRAVIVDTYAEIKVLVAEEELLLRMTRVAAPKPKKRRG